MNMKLNRMTRTFAPLLLAAALVAGLASSAGAVTLRDLMQLSQAGLSDAVLIALIQTDHTVYGVTPDQVMALKNAGVSDPVIVALIRNGRPPASEASQPPAPPAPAPVQAPVPAPASSAGSGPPPAESGVVIIGDHSAPPPEAAPAVMEPIVVTPWPIYYPVAVSVFGGRPGRPARNQAVPPPPFAGFSRFPNHDLLSRPSGIGGSIDVDGLRIVTPRVISVRVAGQGKP